MASLAFSVRRHEPVLVTPVRPTPHEFKLLSDIDDQQGLRFKLSTIYFFRHSPSMRGNDPAKVIKEALAKALVFYYPLAGRLREGLNGKLIVECNAEGVVFVEADADVRLDQFGGMPHSPFPVEKELAYDMEGPAGEIIGGPLLLIQVTRLQCGGFVMVVRFNHTMVDGPGILQFVEAMTDMAKGLETPTIQPVWARELLISPHNEKQQLISTNPESTRIPIQVQPTEEDPVEQSFFLSSKDISTLKAHLPPNLGTCSRFDVLMALTWRSRSIALFSDIPDEEVCAVFHVNCRGKSDPPLPKGYYGNAFALGVARSTTGKLGSNPLDYAVELVRKAKTSCTLADMLLPVKLGRHVVTLADLEVPFKVGRTYLVSDTTNAGFHNLDFGWGKTVYSGPAVGSTWSPSGGHSKFVRLQNEKGLDGVVVPICLPKKAMENFVREMESMIENIRKTTPLLVHSKL